MELKTLNQHERDACIQFEPEGHFYTITRNGASERAPVSVTSFSKPYFEEFDAQKVIDSRYEKWKTNTNSKYYSVIQSTLQAGGTDADAKRAIAQGWSDHGQDASKAGTEMHERAELVCNGMDAGRGDVEMDMLRNWLANFQPAMQWKPWRTEWMLWWEDDRIDGRILVAGTLDLLMRSETTGGFALVDFKRTNPAPKYRGAGRNLLGPCGNPRFHPGYAAPPLNEVENSKYGGYCMQLNVLSKMLREKYNIDVGIDMYLLQIHCDLQSAHCIRVPSLHQATNTMFAVEAERRWLALS